jgi:aerobic-type carbon monoxide dehydrogenase small subunit (CoxS/CutS family)
MNIVTLNVNGEPRSGECEPRMLLSDFLRHTLRLTGTHVGCEQGVCGACTVLIDGVPARSCLALAVQVAGASITTVEGLATQDGDLSAVQEAVGEALGLQCGFCTPGILMSLTAAIQQPQVTFESLQEYIGGHICRCTGYQGLRAAAEALAEKFAR